VVSGLVILGLGFSPGIFWLWYFYKKDRWEPEPKLLVIRSFLLGMVAVLPVVAIEYPFSGLKIPLFSIVVVAPIVEELAKFGVVRIFIYRSVEFDEPMDGIVYAAAVALGFASIENLFYLFANRVNLLPIFVARAILSVPGHALFSSMWGYGLGRAKFSSDVYGRRYIRRGVILAIVAHSLFNLMSSTGLLFGFGLLTLVAVLWMLVLRRIARVEAKSPFKK